MHCCESVVIWRVEVGLVDSFRGEALVGDQGPVVGLESLAVENAD